MCERRRIEILIPVGYLVTNIRPRRVILSSTVYKDKIAVVNIFHDTGYRRTHRLTPTPSLVQQRKHYGIENILAVVKIFMRQGITKTKSKIYDNIGDFWS